MFILEGAYPGPVQIIDSASSTYTWYL